MNFNSETWVVEEAYKLRKRWQFKNFFFTDAPFEFINSVVRNKMKCLH